MTQPQPTAREMSRPEFPATVHAYTDLLQVLADSGLAMTAATLAERTGRVASNVKRDLHKLVDAGVIAWAGLAGGSVGITAKGRRWLDGMAIARGEPRTPQPGEFAMLQHHQLLPDPNQPRRRFAEADMEALAKSIGAEDILQPLLVRPAVPLPFDHPAYPGEGHMIIAGERRWRAVGRIMAADEWPEGKTLPCRIATPEDEADALEKAMAENIIRADLNHLELGLGFERLGQAGRTNRDMADRLGRSMEFIQQHRMVATKLSPRDQQLLADERLKFHDALEVARGKAEVRITEAGGVMLAPLNLKPAEPGPEQPVLEGMEAATSRSPADGEEQALRVSGGQPAPGEAAADEPEPAKADPLSLRGAMALVEIAHKSMAEDLNDPMTCPVGQYWLDRTSDELVKRGFVIFQHHPSGPIVTVTDAGKTWLGDNGYVEPDSYQSLHAAQSAGRPLKPNSQVYGTDWLEFGVAAPAEAPKPAEGRPVYDPRTDATAQAEAEAGEPLICDDCDGPFPTLEEGRCRACAEKAATDDQDWRAAAFALANALTSAAQRVWPVLDHLNKLAEDCPAETARAVALAGDLRTAMADAARLLDAHGFPAPALPDADPEAPS